MIPETTLQILDSLLKDIAYARYILKTKISDLDLVIDVNSGNTIYHILAYSDMPSQIKLLIGKIIYIKFHSIVLLYCNKSPGWMSIQQI